MDFRYSEDQQSVQSLARQIFETEVTEKSLQAVEESGVWLHTPLWEALKQAELLGVAVPVAYGGSGMGLLELFILLEQQGASVAPVPLLPSILLGALSIAEWGSTEQREGLLRELISGDRFVTAGLAERGGMGPLRPATEARRTSEGWSITGEKTAVPGLAYSDRVLVPARVGHDQVGVFWVDPGAAGVTVSEQRTTTGEPLGLMTLREVGVAPEDMLGDLERGASILESLVQRALVGTAAIQLGVSARQLRMLAEYATSREQFGQAIGMFQAVSQRAGDAYIDVESLRVSFLGAAWRLAEGKECQREALIAKYWAAQTGHRVAAAAQHIHGGIGVDCDYPLYRYTLLTKYLEFTLGGANQTLDRLGRLLADPGYEMNL